MKETLNLTRKLSCDKKAGSYAAIFTAIKISQLKLTCMKVISALRLIHADRGRNGTATDINYSPVRKCDTCGMFTLNEASPTPRST